MSDVHILLQSCGRSYVETGLGRVTETSKLRQTFIYLLAVVGLSDGLTTYNLTFFPRLDMY